MLGRQTEMAEAIRLIEAGLTVDIIGNRSSGRSTLLAAIQTELGERGWNVIGLRGIASLRDHPYAALHLSGIGAPSGTRDRSTIQATVDALQDRVGERAAVLTIDDWDDVDESSWGVIEAVRRESGIPLLRVRSRGATARHTPSGLSSATLDPSFVIQLGSHTLETLEDIVAEYLDGPVDISTMSRIYEKSGGSVGLALSIADAAIGDGLLRRSPTGFWTAEGGIWCTALRGIVETHLAGISTESRQALEIVARVGVAELTSVRKLIDWQALEDLEERGMLRLVRMRGTQLVNVTPPLIIDYFRHDENSLRHVRLAEFVAERQGADSSEMYFFQESEAEHAGEERQDAVLRALLVDRARTREIVTRAEWKRTLSPAAAVAYAFALISSVAPNEMVEEVLRDTRLDIGDPQSLADFTALQARWLASVHNDLPAARRLLAERTERVARYAGLLLGHELLLVNQFDTLPDDWEQRMDVTGDEPAPSWLLSPKYGPPFCLTGPVRRNAPHGRRVADGHTGSPHAVHDSCFCTGTERDGRCRGCRQGSPPRVRGGERQPRYR